MQDLLKKFCSTKTNGLLLVDMPTGTGKTYNAVKFIYENYKNIDNKIIFITNLKKNLPINDLRKFFENDNRLDDFNKDFLFLDNNVDVLIEHFEDIENSIPANMFSDGGILHDIKKSVQLISVLKNSIKNKTDQYDVSNEMANNAYFIIKQTQEDLRDKYEKKFRNLIEEKLSFDENGNKRTKAQKLELIKNNKDYSWIKDLYPAVLTDEKKIIYMSIDKFLVRNSTLIEPSYSILDSSSLLNNSIIFIDEFDSSKDVILKNLIENSLDSRVGIIELFRLIYSGLSNTTFSKLLTETSKHLQQQIDENKNRYTPLQILEEFNKKAKEISKDYTLENFHKLESTEKDKASFLFQDYKFHTILGDEKNFVFLQNDKDNNINWIKRAKSSQNDNVEENSNIYLLLIKIKSFLTYFQNGVKLIADNYLYLKKEKNQETNNFSYEAAIKTVLAEFGIEGKYLVYLTTQIMNSRKKREYKLVDLKSDLDCSVYEKGFRFYNFIDNDIFDTQSKINYLSFNITPEKILLYLCRNSKVVGISASGTLNTVTGNYDLNYIKSKLGNDFYQLSEVEKNRIDNFIDKQLGNYEKINVEIDKCEITQENFEEKLQDILGEHYENIMSKINNLVTDSFAKTRYTKLIYSIDKFFKNNIKSFLFLTNTSLKNNVTFNFNLTKNVFELLRMKYGKKDSCIHSLDGNLEKFEINKQTIKEQLKKNKSVFVVSTYQTLGAGQNLQYEFDKEFDEFIESINESDYNLNSKDFDALFLDKPTNLYITPNNEISEDVLLKYIYQVKCLEEVGDFTLDESINQIKTGIKIAYHSSPKKIKIPRSYHVNMHIAKVIMQAVGRICRTKNKSRNIFISFDCTMENELSKVKNELLNKKINYEFRQLLLSCKNVNENYFINVSNINNSKTMKLQSELNNIMQFKSQSDITKWEELRDIVLKYPYDNYGIHNTYDIYCELEKPSSYYYYAKTPDGKYNITDQKFNTSTINEETARLNTLLKVPGLKDYFENHEYATSFEKSKFILLPNVFQRIYLGALGEVAGKFIIEQFANIKLERINNLEFYEKFDFVFESSKYIDFKYWSGYTEKNRDEEVKRVRNKLDKIKGSKAFIVNIIKPQNCDPKPFISADNRIVIIPYLFDSDEKILSAENLKLLSL